jgi:hypothetical protein
VAANAECLRIVLRTLHLSVGKIGLHSFRRFRTAVLRKARVPEDWIGLWLGHAALTVTDSYARQLREDVSFRQGCAEACGLGFELGHVGPQKAVEISREQDA